MFRKVVRRLRRSFGRAREEFERPDMRVLFADSDLRITALGDANAPNLFLCFTGVQQGMGGIGAEEFVGSTEVVPEEQRWIQFRERITEWRDVSLEKCFNDDTLYFTFNGDADEIHWSGFPRKRNCKHILIPNSGHNPAAVLKSFGRLQTCLGLCVRGDSPLEALKDTKANARLI